MRGTATTALLRFREAVAARMFWLLPLHFTIALPVAHAMPGPTPGDRRAAADAVALLLASLLGVVAAAVLGAGPLPTERNRPRGTALLAAPVSPAARVAGTALGTGGALLLLAAGLLASALAVVDLGVGPAPPPRARLPARSVRGGDPDSREQGLVWLTAARPAAIVLLPPLRPAEGPRAVTVEARPRVGRSGEVPGRKGLVWSDGGAARRATASLTGPFTLELRGSPGEIELRRVPGNFDLGIRADGVLLDDGPRSRALARGLHALALGAGLLALMGAALALSTFVGSGVAAAGAMVLVLLGLSRGLFADAARMLAHAGAMERALEEAGGHAHGAVPPLGTPPALAPLFEALAAILPDAGRFDLAGDLVAGTVPDAGAAAGAAGLGLLLAALFLGVAALGARRRP